MKQPFDANGLKGLLEDQVLEYFTTSDKQTEYGGKTKISTSDSTFFTDVQSE